MARHEPPGPDDPELAERSEEILFARAVKAGFDAGIAIPFPQAPQPVQKPRDLFDTYITDPQLIDDDMHRRPAHYTQEHRDVLDEIRAGTASAEARTALLLQYVANDQPAKTTPAPRKKKRDDGDDGDPDSDDEHGSFEEQNHDDEIIII